MKVAPPAAPPPRLTEPTALPLKLGLSFEGFLDEQVALQDERPERAFGFSEFGMLAAHGSAFAKALPCPAEATIEAGATILPAAIPKPDAREPEPVARSIRNTVTPPERQALHEQARAQADLPKATGRQTATFSQPATLVKRPSLQDQPTERAAQPFKPPATPSPSKRFSLVVNEQNGSIQILAGSPELSAEERTRLRRAAASLAEEFGLVLADFTVNGGPLAHPTPTRIGASRGDIGG